MKLLSCNLKNFASYKELRFTFEGGLALVQGSTGSGKSTLCDAAPWALFGKTAKGGSVSEVVRWPGDEVTTGKIIVEAKGKLFEVVRTRGPSAKDNDLYYHTLEEGGVVATRGKDLNDTQALINNLLGMDYELFLSGSYFHEFSQTAQFFITTAKNRRAICEQIMDLSLAKQLQAKLTAARSKAQADLTAVTDEEKEAAYDLNATENLYETHKLLSSRWEEEHARHAKYLQNRSERFQEEKDAKVGKLQDAATAREQSIVEELNRLKAKLYALKPILKDPEYFALARKNLVLKKVDISNGDDKCKECGAPKQSHDIAKIVEEDNELRVAELNNQCKLDDFKRLQEAIGKLSKEVNPYKAQIEQAQAAENIYLLEVEEHSKQVNPHTGAISSLSGKKDKQMNDIRQLSKLKTELFIKLNDIEMLQDIVAQFRAVVGTRTINEIETHTNKLLSDYFDAEIRVTFEMVEADKIEVSITKDGNSCVYSQLSKGQRQLLKLCFGVAVMDCVANHHGTHFSQLFFDEALDGLSDTLKVKAHQLFTMLATKHESVFVVEHSAELKALFDSQYSVSLVNGESQIEES